MRKTISLLILFAAAVAADYDRDNWGFESYRLEPQRGYYTNKFCEKMHVEHVVSLKDAYASGGKTWETELKITFANDLENHVATCAKVNMSKGAALPAIFLQRSTDGKGRDYQIVRWCSYLATYYVVKKKYGLSFAGNNAALFKQCHLEI